MHDIASARRTESAPSLRELSEELLLHIVGDITNYDGSRDINSLKTLCLVDRQFQRIATPFIYELIYTGTHNPYRFVPTLLECPKLGQHLKFAVGLRAPSQNVR